MEKIFSKEPKMNEENEYFISIIPPIIIELETFEKNCFFFNVFCKPKKQKKTTQK